MLSQADNTVLTQTGPGTPMGHLFRRFWMPAALAEEVAKPDQAPRHVRLLGEDLLLFRQSDGQLALIEPRCPHRGADLYWGRNEECGLRCVYHGWKFDAGGACVDIPNMVAGSARDNIMRTVQLKSYPVREAGDLIWAYLGPADKMPELPQMEFCRVATDARYASKKLQECNWAQAVEGGIDTAHFSFTHRVLPTATNVREVYEDDRAKWINEDGAPKYEILEHEAGLTLAGERRAGPGQSYWRVAQFMAPNHSLAPGAMPGETFTGQTFVPIDDENCWIYTYAWNPERALSDAELDRYGSGRSVHAMVDENYVPLRNRANEYLVDRELQKTGNFTGITGLSEQDACIQDSQGRVAPRDREVLTPSDAGVVRFRKLMLGMAKDLAGDTEPAPVQSPHAYCLRSGGAVTATGLSLTEVMQQRFGHPLGMAVQSVLREGQDAVQDAT